MPGSLGSLGVFFPFFRGFLVISRKLGWFLMVCYFLFDIEIGKTVYRNTFFVPYMRCREHAKRKPEVHFDRNFA